ncbi:MAG: tRNA pseudouridine(38-40) synthase TruA [Gammaproteobacteria bacterium]|nr:tRNA pseudouridine(38-40) synthase TruA [Gammaproteobacteria bacterium]
MRIALCLEYDGSHFYGWQYQNPQLRTVQMVLEQALSKVADKPIQVVCAGRTDKGVHALNQIVHFDTDVSRLEKAWVLGGNAYLSRDVSIKWAKLMPDDFHARFSAKSRHYRYFLYDHPIRSAVNRQYVGWFYSSLNETLMQKAAQYLLGEHDFSSFRGADCQSLSPVREIFEISVQRQILEKFSYACIVIDVIANAFLHHMVRNIVGALIPVGQQQQPVEHIQKILKTCDRKAAGLTASPNGLFLVGVNYNERYNLKDFPAACGGDFY